MNKSCFQSFAIRRVVDLDWNWGDFERELLDVLAFWL
jgi:hypothetical protein